MALIHICVRLDVLLTTFTVQTEILSWERLQVTTVSMKCHLREQDKVRQQCLWLASWFPAYQHRRWLSERIRTID